MLNEFLHLVHDTGSEDPLFNVKIRSLHIARGERQECFQRIERPSTREKIELCARKSRPVLHRNV